MNKMTCLKCNSEINETAIFCPECGVKVIDEKLERNDCVWYCLVAEGVSYQKMGPFCLKELKDLFTKGKIDRSSKVWKEGFDEWVPIIKTELFQELEIDKTAPPVWMGNVSNTWVWILAFAPLISLVLYRILGEYYIVSKIRDGRLFTEYSSIINTLNIFSMGIALGLNIFLTWKDEILLKKLGHNTVRLGSFWIVPVYLFKRAKYLNQSPSYAIVWVITFVLSFI